MPGAHVRSSSSLAGPFFRELPKAEAPDLLASSNYERMDLMNATFMRQIILGAALAGGITTQAFAGYSALAWKNAGASTLETGALWSCGAPKTVDIRVSYSLNPTFVIGGPDPACPWGFGPNHFRYTVALYRDGLPLGSHSFNLAGCWFRDWFNGIAAVPGNYYAKITVERRTAPFVWSSLDSMQSPTLVATQLIATPDFTINGTAIPQGTPMIVCASSIQINAATTVCETSYWLGVDETVQWWTQTNQYSWGKWFLGEAPNQLSLQQLATGSAGYWQNGPLERQGNTLVGGFANPPANTLERFYTVALCTPGPTLKCKYALLRVNGDC